MKKRKVKRTNPGKNELRRFWNVAHQVGGFAFDFESVDEKGRPTTNSMEARPILLSLATGKNRPYRALVMEWDETASKFLRGLLHQPITAVAHYHNYDSLQAHWIGCIDLHKVTARLADTRILCWLYNEEEDLDLKTQVWKKLGYRMVSFKEATVDSEFNRAVLSLQNELTGLQKAGRENERILKREGRELTKLRKTHIDELMRGVIKVKEINELKRSAAAEVLELVKEKIEFLHDRIQRETIRIEVLIKKNQTLAFKLFRKYALDDAIQCWRLYRKMMRWVKKANMERWLEIEEANHKRSLLMTVDGATVNQKKTQSLKERSEPLLDEFEADIFNIAKRKFNVRSNKDLPEVLYKDMGIVPPEGTKPSKVVGIVGEPWAFSTRTEVLERIEHPITQAILNYRSVHTIYKNFMVGLYIQAQTDPDERSRVHVIFNSTGTKTGRWSSSSG